MFLYKIGLAIIVQVLVDSARVDMLLTERALNHVVEAEKAAEGKGMTSRCSLSRRVN